MTVWSWRGGMAAADNQREMLGATLKEQFFETDFGELVTDAHMNVIDRQAQVRRGKGDVTIAVVKSKGGRDYRS